MSFRNYDTPVIPSMSELFLKSSSTPTQARLRMITYNVRSARGSYLQIALRAMAQMRIHLGFLLETRITNAIYPHDCCGYKVQATKAKTSSQGGIALFYKSDSDQWCVEGIRTHGPNVISATLVSGSYRWSLVGAYIPPSDTTGETLQHLEQAFRTRCHHQLILFGDLNVDLYHPTDVRAEEIVTFTALSGLSDVSRFFPRPLRGRWTWSQSRENHVITSTTDYILAENPHTFSRWTIKTPRFSSDHRAILAELNLAPAASHRRYVRSRRRFPVRLQRPFSYEDTVFEELRQYRQPPEPSQQRDRSWITAPTWHLIDQKSSLVKLLQHHHPQLCLTLHRDTTSTVHPKSRPLSNTFIDSFAIQDLPTQVTIDKLIESFNALSLQDYKPSPIDELVILFQRLQVQASLFTTSSQSASPSSNISSLQRQTSLAFSDMSNSDDSYELCPHQRKLRDLGKAIRRHLRQDRQQRAERASKYVLTMVTAKNYREAWKCLRGWYRDYSEPISPPLSCDLIQTRSAFQSLYSAHSPPGPAIPIHVSPASVDDTSPSETEIVSSIRKMPRRRSPGASGIRPEDFLRWKSKEPQAWDKLIWLVQHAFTTGRISQAMAIEILTLLPKNEYGKYRGIVLMEAITKLCGTIIHLRIQEAITFHSDIHAFRPGRGTSTAILEAKLLMQSAIEEGKILYQIFLDLSKASSQKPNSLILSQQIHSFLPWIHGLRYYCITDSRWCCTLFS